MTTGIERTLQLPPQGNKLSNAPVNILDMAAGDAVHLGAGPVGLPAERQQLAHGGYFESQFAGMADEIEPRHVANAVTSLLPLCACWSRQQTRLLVVTDRRRLDARPPRQLANREIRRRPERRLADQGVDLLTTTPSPLYDII
jgi:hypothetical protein